MYVCWEILSALYEFLDLIFSSFFLGSARSTYRFVDIVLYSGKGRRVLFLGFGDTILGMRVLVDSFLH